MTKWILLIWVVSYNAFGQQEPVFVPDTVGCLSLSPMPMKSNWEGATEVVTVDSVKVQASIDSAYQLADGTWQLVEIRGGWTMSEKPSQEVKIKLDRQGNGVIYENGKSSTTFQISLYRTANVFYFPIRQQGKAFFFHRCKTSYFLVCQEALVMTERMGDGNTFVFKRVH